MNIAIVGTGFIANMQGEFLKEIDEVRVECVMGITKELADEYGDKFGIEKRYTTYEDVLADEKVDMVYLGLPNDLHYPYARKALEAGKNVIVEKPFVGTVEEAKDLLDLAKAKDLLVFDAITTRYMPGTLKLKERLSDAGQLCNVTTTYAQYSKRFDDAKKGEYGKVFDLKYQGGALKDLGIYPVTFNVEVFGKPNEVHYYPNTLENGCDSSGLIVLEYDNFVSSNIIAKDSFMENRCVISGYEGTFSISDDCFRFPDLLFQKDAKAEKEELVHPEKFFAHHYEWLNFVRIFNEHDTKTCYKYIENTMAIIEVMDELAESAGLIYG